MRAAPNPVDLHTHSTVSDGMLAPAALAAEAGRRGLRVWALTDHDTVAGIVPAAAAARPLGIELVPGVELSSEIPGHDVHLLGYYVNTDDAAFLAALAEFARQRRERAERILAKLAEAGVPVAPERVAALAAAGTVGRPHVARALVEQGHVASIAEAFDRYLARGRTAFVARPKIEPEEAIALIAAAGGVPVLAHPHTTGDVAAMLARLVPAGLRGMEVYYGEYDDARRADYRALADRFGLIPTGGSDFHGPGFRAGRELGGAPVPPESAARLREAAGR